MPTASAIGEAGGLLEFEGTKNFWLAKPIAERLLPFESDERCSQSRCGQYREQDALPHARHDTPRASTVRRTSSRGLRSVERALMVCTKVNRGLTFVRHERRRFEGT